MPETLAAQPYDVHKQYVAGMGALTPPAFAEDLSDIFGGKNHEQHTEDVIVHGSSERCRGQAGLRNSQNFFERMPALRSASWDERLNRYSMKSWAW